MNNVVFFLVRNQGWMKSLVRCLLGFQEGWDVRKQELCKEWVRVRASY